MTIDIRAGVAQDAAESHPYDYFYEPGKSLRPAPSRLTPPGTLREYDFLRPAALNQRQQDLVALLVDHFWQGDRLMDPVVLKFRELGAKEGRRMLDQALDHGIDSLEDPPQELVNLFASLDAVPQWHDPAAWEQGRRLWIDCSGSAKWGTYLTDAAGTYVFDEVSSATGATGRFTMNSAVRFLETTLWYHDATRPEFLDRFGEPFKDTVRVRLMHSQARLALRRSWGDQQFGHHGNPISTSLTLGGAINFGLMPMAIDHNHGRRKQAADLDATMLYWAYIAYVFGVAPEIIPTNAVDAAVLGDYIWTTAGGPTEWTDVMTTYAADKLAAVPIIPGPITRAIVGVSAGAVSYFAGDRLVRDILSFTPYRDVGFEPWKTLAGWTTHANIGTRKFLDALPGARSRFARRSRHSDAWWRNRRRNMQIISRLSGRQSSGYTHHDVSPDTAPGCPVLR